nr:hypothetical protein NPLVJFJD_NPLVJFJD_CDS_0009 [Microvirus sp.]
MYNKSSIFVAIMKNFDLNKAIKVLLVCILAVVFLILLNQLLTSLIGGIAKLGS